MKNIICLLIVAPMLCVTKSYAQILPSISVNAQEIVSVTPDIASLAITISSEQGSKEVINVQEKKMIEVLKEMEVDVKNDLKEDRQVVTFGGRKNSAAEKSYNLTLRQVAKIDQLFAMLKDVGIANASIIKTEYTKRDSIETLCEIKAVEKARQKAEILAKQANVKILQPINISTTVSYNYIRGNDFMVAGFSKQRSVADENFNSEVALKDIEISSNVQIRYLIKQ